jgi:hypothetical protein
MDYIRNTVFYAQRLAVEFSLPTCTNKVCDTLQEYYLVS